jgi:hypothetical protein
MDTKIIDGDMLLDSSGNPVMIKETEEVLQQVIMCITAEKGGFIYDKDMGVQAVTDVSGEKECKRLEAILREATEGVEGAGIYLDSAQQLIDGRILAGITVTYKDDIIPVEVVI